MNNLTETDATRMAALGYQIGFDDDNPLERQFVHICKRSGKALCETSRLWFRVELNPKNVAEITCAQCLVLWQATGHARIDP
jgi:hypothetical protein